MRNCRVYVERRIGNRDFRLCCTLVPVPAASYPPRGCQSSPLLCAISPHLRLRPLPGHRYRLSPCPWLPFTVTWLGRDLPACADSPASSRAVPGTQRRRSRTARQRRTEQRMVGPIAFLLLLPDSHPIERLICGHRHEPFHRTACVRPRGWHEIGRCLKLNG